MRLVLPLEIKNRELEGAISITYEALKKNWKVYIGQKQQFWPLIDNFKPSYWFLKSLLPGEINLLRKIKKKHVVGSLDIEGLVLTPSKKGYEILQRYSVETCKLSDLVFFFGKDHLKMFKKFVKTDKRKLVLCGSPNFDFYKNLKKKKIKFEYMIISSFGKAIESSNLNLRLENALQKQATGITDKNFYIQKKKYDDMLKDYSKKYYDIAVYLAKKNKSKKILFRPHPYEDNKIWTKKFKNIKNIIISRDSALVDDILLSKKIIHFNSTTAFLSNFLKKPTFMYREINCKYTDIMTPNVIKISNIIRSYKFIKTKSNVDLSKYIENVENKNASKIIVNKFSELKLKKEKKNSNSLFIIKLKNYVLFHFKKKFLLKIAAILGFVFPFFEKYKYGLWPFVYRFSYRQKFLEKWPGLASDEIIEKISKIDKKIVKKINIKKHFSGFYEVSLDEKK